MGNGAVQLTPSSDHAEYSGSRSGQQSFADYKGLVSTVADWTVQGTGDFAGTVPDLGNFSVSPIPEPSTWALLAAGLAAVGFVARRRS